MFKIICNFYKHPLAKKNILKSFSRFLRWQIASRVLPEASFIMPFFMNSKLLMKSGMTGATGNWYFGLHEVHEMSFLLKILNKDDYFIDIGSNIGSYTILASSTIGSNVYSFEPIPTTYNILEKNIILNNVKEKVKSYMMGLSDSPGELFFTTNLDTVNHVTFINDKNKNLTKVKIDKLDNFNIKGKNILIKIDVEGYEIPVLIGSANLFLNNNVMAVIIETNSSGINYGYNDEQIFSFFAKMGYKAYIFNAENNELSDVTLGNNNTIFIKNIQDITSKIKSSNIIIF